VRSWKVWFERNGAGAQVFGQQESVVVRAPNVVAPLAEVERTRPTDTLYPVTLNSAGLIVVHGPSIRDVDARKALAHATKLVAARDRPAEIKLLERRDLEQIAQQFSAFGESLPADLFFPSGRSLKQTRSLALPNGKRGSYTSTYQTSATRGRRWLKEARRAIVTNINGIERAASEAWSLEPI